LTSSLPWELISAHTFEDNTISSLGTLVVSAPIRCEFSFPLPNHTPKSLPRSCDVNHLCLSLICLIQYIETLVLMILPISQPRRSDLLRHVRRTVCILGQHRREVHQRDHPDQIQGPQGTRGILFACAGDRCQAGTVRSKVFGVEDWTVPQVYWDDFNHPRPCVVGGQDRWTRSADQLLRLLLWDGHRVPLPHL